MVFWTFTTVGELWYYFSPVCGSPTQWVWDLILSWLLPSYCLAVASSLSLDVGYLFWGGFRVLLSMAVQQPVVILVLLQEEVNAQPSTLPSWTGRPDHHGLISLASSSASFCSLWPVGGTGRRLERLEEREIRVLLPCSIYVLGMFSGSDCIPQGLYLLAGYYSMVPALTGLWGHYFLFLPFEQILGSNSNHSNPVIADFWGIHHPLVILWLCLHLCKQFLHWNFLSHLCWIPFSVGT